MDTYSLGPVTVHLIGFGAMQLPGSGAFGPPRDHDEAIGPYFPLGSAFPGMPNVVDNATVRAVAQRVGASPAQVGLAWLLAYRDNVLLIPGTSSTAHLDENMKVATVGLSDDVAELESAF